MEAEAPKTRDINPEAPTFLGELMYWCYRWGCEIRLTNRAWEFFERTGGALEEMENRRRIKQIGIPEIIFSKDNRQISIQGEDWESLISRVRYDYKRVFMELQVPFWK